MQDDQIIHYSNHAITLGLAQAQVDLNRRHYHSRLHSAGHLIGHVMQAFVGNPPKHSTGQTNAKSNLSNKTI